MEYWDIYDKKGKKKNRIVKKGTPLKSHEYHIIVEGWIQVSEKDFIIQQRSFNKKKFPGMWYCSVSGSVIAGEEPLEGMIRETREELGIDILEENIFLKRIITENSCIFYIYHIKQEVAIKDIVLQKEEVEDVKIVDYDEIKNLISKGKFIHLEYYDTFFENILKI